MLLHLYLSFIISWDPTSKNSSLPFSLSHFCRHPIPTSLYFSFPGISFCFALIFLPSIFTLLPPKHRWQDICANTTESTPLRGRRDPARIPMCFPAFVRYSSFECDSSRRRVVSSKNYWCSSEISRRPSTMSQDQQCEPPLPTLAVRNASCLWFVFPTTK